ncbi:MAG: hypothetical protein QOD26_2193 [Betaproteobacteria bacterium]|jgi:hypothetical protein|nr:hypothetical protein [Betaproteobacteria bacterium]
MKRVLVALLCSTASLCHAARPFNTDDARTVDPGGCQIETFYKEQRAYSGSEFWFLPACNRLGVEWTVGGNRIEGERNLILQAKKLVKPIEPNGYGLAFSVGSFGGDPYINGIASFSFLQDWSIIHSNLGYIENRGTWGLGLEQLILPPRVYGILETYGERGEKPTLHGGIRFWVIPNRFQIDSTYGTQQSEPVRRFFTVGLRFLF